MLRIYRAVIRSKLDYGSVLYGNAPESVLSKRTPVHNAALRLCTGAFRSSPVVSIYADAGVPPLHIRRQQLLLQYYARVCRLEDSQAAAYIRDPILANARQHEESIAARVAAALRNLDFQNITFNAQLYKAPSVDLARGYLL